MVACLALQAVTTAKGGLRGGPVATVPVLKEMKEMKKMVEVK
jgi:hypothetical protein